ncbi:MAG: beta-mannosidase [Bacteroidetes bacterium]|jgi:beta-mannosidase|nr:beta-mannosidase [Bacteroidota bacterium]
MLFSCTNEKTNFYSVNIIDNWTFKAVCDSIWLKATVPGYVHTDLMDNSIINDPYYRLNEKHVQWIDKKDWEYKTTFNIDKKILNKDMVELEFNGLDTYANIYLNDQLILKTDNMFISWVIDCKDYLKLGKNILRIVFESPINIGLQKRENLGYQLPGAENDQSELGGLGNKKVNVFTRKPAYHFGWDWGPRLVSSGIWQDVKLNAWDKAKIVDVSIVQEIVSENEAILQSQIEIESFNKNEVTLIYLIDSVIAVEKKIDFVKGSNSISVPLIIENPELWWTNGLGNQKLYNIEVLIKDDSGILSSREKNIGLRTLEVIQQPDSIGKSFYFRLNGYPVFMKGANYIPQDVFLTRVTDDDYERIIKAAADANFNMLRVWGGGIYEREIFYDLCDEYGILVWQDFMFACAMYPGNKEFLDNVEKEAVQIVKRLRNHPCIALWCGDNEILSAWNRWGWKENVVENQGLDIVDTIWEAYKDIFHDILPRVVNQLDPQKLYWSSSPSSGFGELENGKSGDQHYWGVWWAKEPFSKYEEVIPRFMSEFGFQSFPALNSVKKYSIEEDWDINSDVMKSHQRSGIGNATIEEYLLRDYHKPKDFEMFLYVGQLLQARGITIGIEAHRRNMPHCMGSLYWQLNDCWPVSSWSGIDYYGDWKALHYAVKKAFKNLKISFKTNNDNLEVFIISDSLQNTKASLELTIIDFYGNILNKLEKDIVVESNCSQVYLCKDIPDLVLGNDLNNVLISAVLSDSKRNVIDESLYYFVPPKDLKLPDPKVTIEVENRENNMVAFKLATEVLAKNVYLQCNVEGHFSENYFDLLPNSEMKLFFISEEEVDINDLRKGLTVYTLVDSFE